MGVPERKISERGSPNMHINPTLKSLTPELSMLAGTPSSVGETMTILWIFYFSS